MTDAQLLMLAVDDVFPDSSQPRRIFDKDATDRMEKSIKARGVLQPIRVRWDAQRGCWLLVNGESRWRAAKAVGLATVPAVTVDHELSDTDVLGDQLIENIVRDDLRPMELARSLARLHCLRKCTSKELAAELGLQGSKITRAEALLTLPEKIQTLIDDGAITADAGYQLSRLPGAASQNEMAAEIIAGRVTRDQTAKAVQKVIGKKKTAASDNRQQFQLAGGVNVTLTANSALTCEVLFAAAEQLRKHGEKLQKNGKTVADPATSLATKPTAVK